jgi:UDP-2-acetamido-2,6-beta-L-arabino-hexul-4-ose reductase
MANKKIGITGHNGFLGTHLKKQIKYQYNDFEIINFKRSFFQNQKDLSAFINNCDIIIHLAGLNRHNSQEEILKTNVLLAEILGDSLIKNEFEGILLFSSSLQEYKDTHYGRSKKQASEILAKKAKLGSFSFIKMIIPNIFGPFGQPQYNSFITTFSHQLIEQEKPEIIKDSLVPLIYVEDVVYQILETIKLKGIHSIEVPHKINKKVSEILTQLKVFNTTYIQNGVIPEFKSLFDIQLFNTFRSAVSLKDSFPRYYKIHSDQRGYFTELMRAKSKGQVSFSVTKSGVTRGDHFHTRKIERFSVIQGDAIIAVRTIGNKNSIEFKLNGKKPGYVDIPIWTTHNITNTGEEDLITVFWINEHFVPEDDDVYFEKV